MLRLVQVRRCDGKCCEESPRFPNATHTDCIYHAGRGGCRLMRDPALIPTGESPTQPGRPAAETFQKTCVDFPHNLPAERGTGGCCWQPVSNGN